MTPPRIRRVLFTGYAPVHFLCFRPIYEALAARPGFQVHLSGGLRTKAEGAVHYDHDGLYRPMGVPPDRILSVGQIQQADFDLTFAANTKLISPRSPGIKIQIFHGISFRNASVREEICCWDYYFLVGPYMRRKLAEAKLLAMEDPRGLPIGFPKTDPLLNGSLDQRAVLSKYGFDGRRPVVVYAPTGQKHNSLETMGEEVIRRLASAGRFDLLIKAHDHPKNTIDWLRRLAPLEDGHARLARDPDVIPLLHAADLLISDASSVSSEFSLLNRPMVFLDVPKLLDKSARANLGFDLSTWGRRAGIIVRDPKDVVAAVESGLQHPEKQSDLRQAMAQDLFFNPGRATPAAIDWILRNFG
jgi:hypothetical protein